MNEAVYIPAIINLSAFFGIAIAATLGGLLLCWIESRADRLER